MARWSGVDVKELLKAAMMRDQKAWRFFDDVPFRVQHRQRREQDVPREWIVALRVGPTVKRSSQFDPHVDRALGCPS